MADPSAVFSEKAIEEVSSLIGKPLRQGPQFNEVACADVIRHFAQGYGDPNPLWSDRGHAAATRWGGIIAPPTFLFSCVGNVPTALGFPGAHALWAEDEWAWYLPVREGDRITSELRLQDCRRIYQKFADPMYAQEAKFTFRNQTGAVIAEEVRRTFRFARHTGQNPEGERHRYKELQPWTYSDEDIARIYADCDREVIRGNTPRYFEDVRVGEEMPHVVKGPLTVTDVIAWKIGCGFPPFIRAHKMRADYERRHPSTAVKNSFGIPDVPERVHWEEALSRLNGIPVPFDYGYQRVTWMVQAVTNWMGDDGVLRNCKVRLRKPNVLTDTCWCRGKVVDKQVEGDTGVVRCELWAENQRGWVVATGEARVLLPRRPAR